MSDTASGSSHPVTERRLSSVDVRSSVITVRVHLAAGFVKRRDCLCLKFFTH